MHRSSQPRAFALIEVILVVAAIAVLSTAGYFTVTQVRETARANKLETDVANLNNAVQMYVASGGDISGATTVSGALNKLKTRADAQGVAKQVGMKGSFIDPRTVGVSQSEGEAGSSQSRAVWNAAKQKFEVTSSGAGVKAFSLDNSLSAEEVQREARSRTLTAADVNSESPVWIWDHTDVTPVASIAGQVPGQAGSTSPGNPAGDDKMVLSAPTFFPSGGNYSIAQLSGMYPANVDGGGNIIVKFSANNPGVACAVMPGDAAIAQAALSSNPSRVNGYYTKSFEPDVWQDSAPATEQQYSITPLPLEVSISSNIQSPGPYQLGVSPTSGSFTQATFTATISNGKAYPEFQPPGFASLKVAAGSSGYSNGVTSLSDTQTLSTTSGWDTSSGTPTLALKAKADPVSTILFTSSAEATSSLSGSKETLSASFSPSGGDIAQSGTVTITASSSPTSGVFPQAYSIRYTTDNSTPTSSSNLYTGPITLSTIGDITLKAVVLPPTASTAWFNSPMASASYTVSQPGGSGNLASGILTSSLTLNSNALVQGSVTIVQIPGQNPVFNMNSNAHVTGSIYFPGLPTITRNANVTIAGGIVDLSGTTTPVYNVTFNSNAKVDGTVYRRSTPVTMPTVTVPTGLTNYSGTDVGTKKTVTLPPGKYTSTINANSQSTINIPGTGGGSPAQYVFNGLNLNSGSKINVTSPVVVTMQQTANFNSNTVVGNPDHPEYLQINVMSGDININSNVSVYAQIVAPNSTVTFNSNATFKGSVTAKQVIINSNSTTVEFNLPPISG